MIAIKTTVASIHQFSSRGQNMFHQRFQLYSQLITRGRKQDWRTSIHKGVQLYGKTAPFPELSPGKSDAAAYLIELVFPDFATQRVAMDAKNLRGAALVAVGTFQHALYKFFLKFSHGLLEQNAPFNHQAD
jgi:hypothetical protein